MSHSSGLPAAHEELQRLLDPHLQSGDAFLVRKDEEQTKLEPLPTGEPPPRSPLLGSHPRFYGQLLAMNQRIGAVGGGLVLLALIGAATCCYAIHARLFHGFFTSEAQALQALDELRSWYVYAIITASVLWCWARLNDLLEARGYAQERSGIRAALAREGLDLHEVLAWIEDDGSLGDVSNHMKRDRTLAQDI